MGAEPHLVVCDDPSALAQRAAGRIVEVAAESIGLRGRFTIALAGGSTPLGTYELLASERFSAPIDWSRTYVFFGDERCVPLDDDRSNYSMANRALLSRVPIPQDHVFPIRTGAARAARAAYEYSEVLARFFGMPAAGSPPRLDLLLLGLGSDGHTASLFPGAESLEERRAWVTFSPAGLLPPPVDRVTLTLPVLDAAWAVMFLVAGPDKSAILRQVLRDPDAPRKFPAARVRPRSGSLTWYVDKQAAAVLDL